MIAGCLFSQSRRRRTRPGSHKPASPSWATGWADEAEGHRVVRWRQPRHVLHTFWNPGPEPARLVEIIAPAGLEEFFAELARLIEAASGPEDERIVALCERYGLSFDHSWIAEIEERFGPLRLV